MSVNSTMQACLGGALVSARTRELKSAAGRSPLACEAKPSDRMPRVCLDISAQSVPIASLQVTVRALMVRGSCSTASNVLSSVQLAVSQSSPHAQASYATGNNTLVIKYTPTSSSSSSSAGASASFVLVVRVNKSGVWQLEVDIDATLSDGGRTRSTMSAEMHIVNPTSDSADPSPSLSRGACVIAEARYANASDELERLLEAQRVASANNTASRALFVPVRPTRRVSVDNGSDNDVVLAEGVVPATPNKRSFRSRKNTGRAAAASDNSEAIDSEEGVSRESSPSKRHSPSAQDTAFVVPVQPLVMGVPHLDMDGSNDQGIFAVTSAFGSVTRCAPDFVAPASWAVAAPPPVWGAVAAAPSSLQGALHALDVVATPSPFWTMAAAAAASTAAAFQPPVHFDSVRSVDEAAYLLSNRLLNHA